MSDFIQMSDFLMKTKNFSDGYIYPSGIGLFITLCPTRYASNDIYSIQRLVSWHELYYMPLKHRNMAMLRLLEYLCDEYKSLNGRKEKKYETD